ncbi:unnamed protein product [Lymnaea stagnalis]|uniref:DOMON domain-containing protein n=1 Tax=Lymnaea stagnalis TaxID=6523 RepID=A0AAV2I1J5_LYMST
MLLLTAAILVTSLGFLETSASDDGELSVNEFPYQEVLNEDYTLYWNFNSTHIIFKSVVKTKGFVGFGISPDGGMVYSDIAIGWVNDGRAYFIDTFTEGHYISSMVAKKDWQVLSGTEVGDVTTLIFLRKLFPCEPKNLPISEGTTRVIYSYGPNDPSANNSINYHGYNRGSKSILLLNPPMETPLPDDVTTVEFLNKDFALPGEDTHYRCRMFKVPDLGQKHHVIRVEPVIQPGSEEVVHHMVLYACHNGFDDQYVGTSFRCYTETPEALTNCEKHVFAGWAVGAEGYSYPDVVGHSLGAPGDPVYFKLQIHYSNPSLRTDVVDNSGLRLFLTKKLRRFDAGMAEAGVFVDRYLAIPPYEQSFLASGYCTPECINQNLGDQEIKVIGVLLHSHLLARKMRTRHIRNGVELAPILEDNTYDFNYQQTRILKREIAVKKGDFLVTECDYDSRQRTRVTYGGLNTTLEMCMSYLLYYPKTTLTSCYTSTKYKFDDHTNVGNFVDAMNKKDWTNPDVRRQFKKDVQEAEILDYCGVDTESTIFPTTSAPKPEIKVPYKQPNLCDN